MKTLTFTFIFLFACSTMQKQDLPQKELTKQKKQNIITSKSKTKEENLIKKLPEKETPPTSQEKKENLRLTWKEILKHQPKTISIGGPSYGELKNPIKLPLKGIGFRHNPHRDIESTYGTQEMVAALLRAAEKVALKFDNSEVTISDLSLQNGGPIDGHGSHQNGRDVDVLFYIFDKEGKPMPGVGAFLDEKGRGYDFKDLATPDDDVLVKLDVKRSWYFLEALLEDNSPASLARIFLAEHIRSKLISYAEKHHRPKKLIQRFENLTCQPSHPHDDHFHFRFFCTPEDIDLGCEDTRPIYPWHQQKIKKLGKKIIIASRKKKKKSKITTIKEARKKAKKEAANFDKKVNLWLKKRDAWIKPPKTGRKYCR